MPSFMHLAGKRVEVCYRAGDVHMTVVGTLGKDTGEHIHLEDHFFQAGGQKTLRIEIPYSSILRIREVPQPEASPVAS